MLTWEVQYCKSSCITLHGGEVFGKVVEALHKRRCLVPDLKISSQTTEYLVLGDCKNASPGRNKVKFLTEPCVSSKGKYLSISFFLCI
jgi:hypothetical protein